jgi:ribosome-binding factor A
MMESTRQSKVARLIQKDLGEIFQRLDKAVLQGKLVTVTVVRVSPDLSFAKVFLSIFPSENTGEYLEHLQHYTKTVRTLLAQRVKNQLRIIPEIAFVIDDSMDYANRIEELLKK